jgi:hypothetical protein
MNFCTFLAVMLVINSIALFVTIEQSRKNRLAYYKERIRRLEHQLTPAQIFAISACLDVAQPSEDDTEPCEIWDRAKAAVKQLEPYSPEV